MTNIWNALQSTENNNEGELYHRWEHYTDAHPLIPAICQRVWMCSTHCACMKVKSSHFLNSLVPKNKTKYRSPIISWIVISTSFLSWSHLYRNFFSFFPPILWQYRKFGEIFHYIRKISCEIHSRKAHFTLKFCAKKNYKTWTGKKITEQWAQLQELVQ